MFSTKESVMRKLLITLAATSAALVAAAPASAQGYYGGGHGQYGQRGHYGYPGDRGLIQRFDQQISNLQQRIERSAQRRLISPGEYRSLRNHSAELRQRLHRFAYNGLSRGEVQDIADRIDNLRERIRDERRDRYDDGYGRGW
jgi:Spy/CpxP family protein refolding chaperone